MEVIHIIPAWFLSLNIVFQILFMTFTAIIAFYSFKIYKISSEKETKNFGLAFAFLSISYLLLIILNNLFLSIMQGNLRILDIEDILGIKNVLVFSYLFFFLLGFLTLFYTTLKTKSRSIFIILFVISFLSILFSKDPSMVIYLLTSIFLFLISVFYFKNYLINKNKNTLLVAIATTILLISNFFLAFVADYNMPNIYVCSRCLEVIAYSMIILSLYNLIKNGKKKK